MTVEEADWPPLLDGAVGMATFGERNTIGEMGRLIMGCEKLCVNVRRTCVESI